MDTKKGIEKVLNTLFNRHSDFLNLSHEVVRSVEALVRGGNLLNGRQCQDLSFKLSKTVHSIEDLVFQCGGSTDLFRPALENLYRIFEKARILVNKCYIKDDWIKEAVFQIENAKDFQVILLEAGLCYHAIYEQAKGVNDAWSFQHEDLRKSSTFRPSPISDVHDDQEALKWRLEDLVSSQQNSPKKSVEYLQHCLARYLLLTWECISQQSQSSELDLSSALLRMEENGATETWGKGDYLGGGTFGGVSSCTWLGIPCAKKVFHEEPDERLFLKEAGILFHLNHPNVVKFFCCGHGQEVEDCFIAMELMEMSLSKLISKQARRGVSFLYPVVIDIIVQIARAMCYLHWMGVAHRDLKPQNVVVNKLSSQHLADQYCVKLVDFGLSKVKVEALKSNTMTKPGIGTTKYRAPEAHPKAHPAGHGKVNWFKADVYSFGITCAHLLSLKEPFENMNLGSMYAELVNGQLKPEVPATVPDKLVALLNNCWDTRPSSRPSFIEICIKLEGVRHDLLRGLSTPNQSFKQEVRTDSTSYEFIRIEVEEHSAIWRQHVGITDEVMELEPTLDSVITNDIDTMDAMECEALCSGPQIRSFFKTGLYTEVINKTGKSLRIKVGCNLVFIDLSVLPKDCSYKIHVDPYVTYQEYLVGKDRNGRPLIISSDDCADNESITILEDEAGNLRVETKYRTLAPRQVPSVPSKKGHNKSSSRFWNFINSFRSGN